MSLPRIWYPRADWTVLWHPRSVEFVFVANPAFVWATKGVRLPAMAFGGHLLTGSVHRIARSTPYESTLVVTASSNGRRVSNWTGAGLRSLFGAHARTGRRHSLER